MKKYYQLFDADRNYHGEGDSDYIRIEMNKDDAAELCLELVRFLGYSYPEEKTFDFRAYGNVKVDDL